MVLNACLVVAMQVQYNWRNCGFLIVKFMDAIGLVRSWQRDVIFVANL